MKLARLVFLIAALVLISPQAFAQPTWFYVRADAGASFSSDLGGEIDDNIGTATLFGLGVGFKILPFIRTDLTVHYRNGYEIDTTANVAGLGAGTRLNGDVSNLTGMLNAYFDFPAYSGLQPYIGGGVGVAYNDVDSVSAGSIILPGDTSTEFAWNVGAGLTIGIFPGAAIDLGYRYADLGKIKTESVGGVSLSGDLTAHEVMAGLRVGF